MAKIKLALSEDQIVPELGGLVLAGQVVDVPDEDVWRFTQSEIWEAVDKDAKAAREAGRKARDERVRDELERRRGRARVPDPGPDTEKGSE